MAKGNGFQPGGNVRPSTRREMDDLWREIRKLWAAVQANNSVQPDLREFIFSWSRTFSGTKTSGPWHAYNDLVITGVGIGAASSSSVTVAIKVDGVTAKTFTLSGTRYEELCRIEVPLGSQVQATVSGTGEDLTITCRYVVTARFPP